MTTSRQLGRAKMQTIEQTRLRNCLGNGRTGHHSIPEGMNRAEKKRLRFHLPRSGTIWVHLFPGYFFGWYISEMGAECLWAFPRAEMSSWAENELALSVWLSKFSSSASQRQDQRTAAWSTDPAAHKAAGLSGGTSENDTVHLGTCQNDH